MCLNVSIPCDAGATYDPDHMHVYAVACTYEACLTESPASRLTCTTPSATPLEGDEKYEREQHTHQALGRASSGRLQQKSRRRSCGRHVTPEGWAVGAPYLRDKNQSPRTLKQPSRAHLSRIALNRLMLQASHARAENRKSAKTTLSTCPEFPTNTLFFSISTWTKPCCQEAH